MVKIGRVPGAKIATGQYTGDGTVDQYITGIGFQPQFVQIWGHEEVEDTQLYKFTKTSTIMGGDRCVYEYANYQRVRDNRIISLDADGFSVGDMGTDFDPNTLGSTYDWIAFG